MRNEIRTPGYALTHLRTSYTWKSLRVDFGVENLFDKDYVDTLSVANTGLVTATVGDPRTIGVTLRSKF